MAKALWKCASMKRACFLAPSRLQTYAKDLHESIKRGDVDQASFAFRFRRTSGKKGTGDRTVTSHSLAASQTYPSSLIQPMRPRK